MKKALLLLVAGVTAAGAEAQYARQLPASVRSVEAAPFNSAARSSVKFPAAARTTAASFYTQDFGGGIPAGWNAVTTTGGTWKWTQVASSSAFTMGAMNSTTASNGWMIYDSDSIGAACSCAPRGYLQTSAFNFSSHSTVRLNFENYYRSFYDSCVIWVSTDPTFASYTRYPVALNMSTPTNVSTANTSVVHVNITSAAALQPSVYIRFVYYGYAGGSYSWMIDDMSLSELDPVEVSVNSGSILYYGGSDFGSSSFGSKPLRMMDTLFPAVYASNAGATGFPAASIGAAIFQGSTSVYTNTQTAALPVDAYDSFVVFNSYLPASNGTYRVPFGIVEVGDADMTNNTDTTTFGVTDSVWNQYPPLSNAVGVSYIYRPVAGSSPIQRTSTGSGFVVAPGRVDTLTSVSACFSSATTAGQVVGAQIYHFDVAASAWVYDGLTKFHALTASEISASAAAADLKWANFKVDVAASGRQIVLEGGTSGAIYVAVIKGDGNTSEVSLYNSDNPAPYDMIGTTGYSDSSFNDGGATQQFGADATGPYRTSYAPMVALNFGKVDYTLGVRDLTSLTATVGRAYPNPANTMVTVPFTALTNTTVAATLTDVVGNVVKAQTISAKGGENAKATFHTADLAAGVYMYNIEVDGQHFTGRISVTH